MDGIRPRKQSWLHSALPKLKRQAETPPDFVSPYTGSADHFRAMARQKLEASIPNPSANLVEFTALQLVENRFLDQASGEAAPVPESGQPRLGMLGNQAYMSSLVSSQLACMPALAPVLISVLGDLDPAKILGEAQSNGSNKWIVAGGSLEDQITASRAIGSQGQVLGIPLTGVIDPGEQGRLARALQPLVEQVGPERLQRILKNLHIQTFLGEMQNGSPGGMGGLGGGGQIAIARDGLLDPNKAQDYLGHELGHLVDAEMGPKFGVTLLSDHAVSPFGKGEPGDFRSEYARHNAMEDFAETHSDLMLNWRQYKQFPELGMMARGVYGQKLMFIAQNCYDWAMPPARPYMVQMAEDVREGRSPLGYRNAAGEVVDADKQLQRILKTMMGHIGKGGVLDEAQFMQVSKPEKIRRQWVLKALRKEPQEAVETVSVSYVNRTLARASELPHGHPEKASLGSSVVQALEFGGAEFTEECNRQLSDTPWLQGQLYSMRMVAGSTWQSGA
jgi:hypothetical protein